ncbi:hypothetical protein HID58_027999, partial [Brassica napus]
QRFESRKIIFKECKMGDDNPRIMHGVIITVYVDRRTTPVRSFRVRRRNECTWNREIGRARGYDRRANLLAYIRQMRAESLARDSKDEDDVVENNIKPERKLFRIEVIILHFLLFKKWKKKRRWLRKMMSKLRLPFLRPFRRKNRTWKYRHFAPDEEEEGEAKNKPYRSDLWSEGYHAAAYEVEETHEGETRIRNTYFCPKLTVRSE